MKIPSRIIFVLIGYLLAVAVPATAADAIVVVVNSASPFVTLSQKEISDLYLGRWRKAVDGKTPQVIDLPLTSPVRTRFYESLTGKEIATVNAYWARLIFSGQIVPPRVVDDSASVLDLLKKNPGMIAYLDHVPNDRQIKVLLTLPDRN